MRGKVDCFGRTDVGCVRESNQDQFLIADLRKSIEIHHSSLGYDKQTQFSGGSRAKLFIVADGMGGYAGGERASWMAVEGIVQYLLTNLHWPITCATSHESHFFKGLSSALEFSQAQIRNAAELYPEQGKMGTTLTMAWVVWPTVYLIHVGDSRAYLYRDGQLQLLSHDQTLAQALADNGVIDPAEVDSHRYRNVLVSALGCTSNMEPLYGRHELRPNDKLMICSDGLTKHVPDERIAQILGGDDQAESLCNSLVDDARDGGGTDNITAVLAQFLVQWSESKEAEFVEIDLEESLVDSLDNEPETIREE
ncbi:MAG: PP2C family protein-serine/threonine phosphatase [Rubripirellula sp.]